MTDTEQAPLAGGLGARIAALHLVELALDHRGGLEEAMSHPPFGRLEPRDRGLARMLAMTLLRRLGPIDKALEAKLQKPPPPPVMMLLRLGVAQLLYMDVPAFAAINTTVQLTAQGKSTRNFKNLVNAVLRGVSREPAPQLEPEVAAPGWLYARWSAAFGEAAARDIAGMIPEEPATDLSLRDPADADALAEALQAERLAGGGLRVAHGGDITAWAGYVEGQWWVQDAAAAIPARLLAARAGETAIDLCAAPGGKTLQLAAAGAEVVALDRSASRLRRVSQSLERTDLKAEVICAENESWPDERQFDAVLLDAPCSATGTFRRHPDVLWGTKPGDIAKLSAVQSRMLDAAARRVKPGGRMVYCVCSLEREEGEDQVAAFLKRSPDFTLVPVAPGEGGTPAASITAEGAVRILPHHMAGGMDGFFAARLVRAG
jgi:16S rRNA (cytosine967-C5)-methyltransferase